jgi:CDP-diacylglycerol--serine O-phosphatidyltransferase
VREFVTPPNLVTSGNVLAGFLALILVTQHEYAWAAGLVVVAAGLDVADGAMARRGTADRRFGSNLDSLADFMSFGAVPALALYVGQLHRLPFIGVAACSGFVLCGAWRLARFPLVANPGHFVGLPIPPSGVIAALVAAWGPPPALAVVVTLALAGLMISAVPFPSLSRLRRLGRSPDEVDMDRPPIARKAGVP